MFLAITALEDFWDASKEILFLGSWCPASCHSTAGFERPYHLMPSPWDDRERYYRAAAYVDACSEALLRELSHYLNGVHGTNHSERYWRIVLGPWLILYTSIIYDRFVHLKAAFAEYRDLETIGMLDDGRNDRQHHAATLGGMTASDSRAIIPGSSRAPCARVRQAAPA